MPLKTLAWLLIPLLGLLELGGHFFFAGRAPRIEEWRAVRGVVEELRKNGEVVVVAPAWAEPNARHAFGDALMPVRQVARADESAFKRAIEVGILGDRAPELDGWRAITERREGKFRFRVVENPSPASVMFDFIDELKSATVADKAGGATTPCRYETNARRDAGGLHGHPAFPSERHVCSGGDWHFAGVTVIEDEQWRGRRCIWAEPAGNKTLSIQYENVPMGDVVRGYATLPWWIEREGKGLPVNLDVFVDGARIGHYVHRDGDGWKLFKFRTGAKGKHATVEFRVSSPGGRDRQFCFAADTR